MKKAILITITVFGAFIVKAQPHSGNAKKGFAKGSWLIEANTGFGAVSAANTGFNLTWANGVTSWNVGAEGGYFLFDRLAIKGGLGYGNGRVISLAPLPASAGGEGGSEGGSEGGNEGGSSFSGTLSYKLGAKYYLVNRIPIQLDFSGNNIIQGERYIGLQAGYAFPLAGNITVEPGFRYDLSINNSLVNYSNAFQFNVGFALKL